MYRPRGRFRREEIARINHFIRVPEVRVISEDGEQLGVLTTDKAIGLAREAGLDLVEIAPKAKPPVTKIMDYGKYKYEQMQKAKIAKKKQTIIEVKEIKFRPKIGVGDYETKKRHVERFLQAGSKVKITIMFRGREMAHPELGRQILDKLAEDVAEFSNVESPAKQDGRNMVMVLGSTIKKVSEEEKEKQKPDASSREPENEKQQTQKEEVVEDNTEEKVKEDKETKKEVKKETKKADVEKPKEKSQKKEDKQPVEKDKGKEKKQESDKEKKEDNAEEENA